MIFEFENEWDNLLGADLEEFLVDLAPYLVKCEAESELNSWLKDNSWGDSKAMYIKSNAAFHDVFLHLRNIMHPQKYDGVDVFFRFYDPRVMRVFLPTCTNTQLKEFFGPIQKFICEDEDSNFYLVYSLNNKQLKVSRKSIDDIFEEELENTEVDSPDIDTIV